MPITSLVDHLRRLIAGWPAGEGSDAQFLERFVQSRDEDAFAELVRRHGPMVLSVCRRLLGNEHDAEEAFQATFLVLARKAGTVRQHHSLGGWLYTSAFRAASELRRRRMRTGTREEGDVMDQLSGDEIDPQAVASDRETAAILDVELQWLPEKYRTALVLCYYEGQTHEQAAQQMGIPLGTLKDRVRVGRDLLGRRLRGRGVTLSVAAITSTLTTRTVTAAVPPTLLQATLRAAVANQGISPRVLNLTEATMRTLGTSKLQWATAALVLLALGLGGVGLAAFALREPPPRPVVKGKEPAKKPQAVVLKDGLGDPLPKGALVRLGTLRWRGVQSGRIRFLQFLPGGKTVITAGRDGTVRWVEQATGKELKSVRLALPKFFQKNAGSTPNVAFNKFALSADGKTLATDVSVGKGGACFVWSPLSTKNRHGRFYPGLLGGLAGDGKTLVVAVGNATVEVWDVPTRKKLRTVVGQGLKPGETFDIESMTISPDGKLLAQVLLKRGTAVAEGHLQLIDVASGKRLHVFNNFGFGVASPVFSADGKRLAWEKTVFFNGVPVSALVVSDVKSGKELQQFKNISSPQHAYAFLPDGDKLITHTFGMPGACTVLDVKTGRKPFHVGEPVNERGTGTGGHSASTRLAVSPDGKVVAFGGYYDDVIRLANLKMRGQKLPKFVRERNIPVGHTSAVNALAISADSRTITTLSAGIREQTIGDDEIHRWNAKTGKLVEKKRLPPGLYKVFSPSGEMALGYEEPFGKRTAMTLALYDTSSGKKIRQFPYGLPLGFSPDEKTVVMAEGLPFGKLPDGGKTIRKRFLAYSTVTGKLLWRKMLETPYVQETVKSQQHPFVRFTLDSRQMVAFLGDKKLRVLDAPSRKLLRTVPLSESVPIADAALAPKSRHVALLFVDGSVSLWDAKTGKRIRQYHAPRKKIKVAKLSFQLFPPPKTVGQARGARWISISPDGNLLAVAPRTNDAFVYDVATGKELACFRGHEQIIESLAFAPDGKTLVTVSADTTGLVWDVSSLGK